MTGLEPVVFCSQNRHITYYATPSLHKLDAIRIELISNTCKVLILPLNYATIFLLINKKLKSCSFTKIGLIGIEPITFRYERNILPLNYRIKHFKNCKKIIYKKVKLVRVNDSSPKLIPRLFSRSLSTTV